MCDYLVFMTYVGRFSPKSTPPRWNVSCLLVYYRQSEHCAMHQQRLPCSWQVWRLCPSSGCYSLAVVAVHLLKLCCSLCCDPDYLQHAFFALISALCCPRSWAQAEWIFNHMIHSLRTSCSELEWVETVQITGDQDSFRYMYKSPMNTWHR